MQPSQFSSDFREIKDGISVGLCVQANPISRMETIPERPRNNSTAASSDLRSKEQRRRERRERRAARRQAGQFGLGGHYPRPPPLEPYTIYGSVYGAAHMPDILNSHLPPPPYSTLPSRSSRTFSGQNQPAASADNNSRSASAHRTRSWRALPTISGATTDLRRSHVSFLGEDNPKSCCGVNVSQTVSIRWFIVMIAFVGICCSIVGTVLGAMKASGREHLTVSLLMIGVGIVLITVSGIAWRLTATDAPSCRAMLGLGGCEEDYNNGRFLSRPQVTTNNNSHAGASRPQHPYAAMMYSDFHYRPPPPSYQASMQEYRLRLLLLDRQPSSAGNHGNPGPGLAVEPPPNYRAHLRNAMVNALSHSRPPSYRSHVSDHAIIESVMDNSGSNNVHSGHGSLYQNRSSGNTASHHVQVAQIHPVPPAAARASNNAVSGSSSHHQRAVGPAQDVSIVSVSSKTDLKSESGFHHHYHMMKIGDDDHHESHSSPGICDTSPLYERIFEKRDEKRSVVTIVQASSAESHSNPVIVTVSGSMGLNTSSSESGSDFSSNILRASPAEVEILATL